MGQWYISRFLDSRGGYERERARKFHVQGASIVRTSVAGAPITAKVPDSWYMVPLGHLHGVPEVDEQAGRREANAKCPRKPNGTRKDKSIVDG